jgi:hypothetical protein
VKRIELGFRQRPVLPSELHRDVVEPAGCEAAIEMPQARNDHPGDRGFDIGAGLIEDEEIEALPLGEAHAGQHLLALVETAELRAEVRPDRRLAARRQIGLIPQPQCTGVVMARCLGALPCHETDGQKLIELGQRAQRGDPRIEVRAGTELDMFMGVFDPVRYRHEARNPEIVGDVEHPHLASGFGKLDLQVAGVGIVELSQVHFRPLQSVVPPDRV